MMRRIGFFLSGCGLVFVLLSLSTVLFRVDFVYCVVGFGFMLLGIFLAINSVAKR